MSWLSKIAKGGLVGAMLGGGIGSGGIVGVIGQMNRQDTRPQASPVASVPNYAPTNYYNTKQGVIDPRGSGSQLPPTTPGPGLYR